MSTHRRTLAAVAAATLVAACAPDEFKPSPGFDGFLDLVGQECYPDTIGGVLVKQLAQGFGPGGGSGAGFIDATSNLYYGKMTPFAYRQFVTAFSDNGTATNKAIDCIIGKLPAVRPGVGGATGVPAGRDGVPPPPPSR
jgi:hypothetical protein